MELTREEVEKLAKCGKCDSDCKAHNICLNNREGIRELLSTMLLAELDKPKDDVWNMSPDNATRACVIYSTEKGEEFANKSFYRRTLPKSPEREIAEKIADKRWITETLAMNKKDFADAIESAINEYKEREK